MAGTATTVRTALFFMIILFNIVLGPVYWWATDEADTANGNWKFASGWMGLVVIIYTGFIFYAYKMANTSFSIGGLCYTSLFFMFWYLRDGVFYAENWVGNQSDTKPSAHAVAGLAAFQFVLHLFFVPLCFFTKEELISEASFGGQHGMA